MYREEMLGRLPLAIHNLTDEGIETLFEMVKLLGGKDGPAWIEHLKGVRSRGLPSQSKGPLLVSRGVAELGPSDGHDPQDFYNNEREGSPRIMGRKLRTRLARAQKVEYFEGVALPFFETTDDAFDKSIKEALPQEHDFQDESEFWEIVAQLTTLQSKGEKGPLAVNGSLNLFYLPDLVATLLWKDDEKRWHVNEREPGNGAWNARRRVFSRSRR